MKTLTYRVRSKFGQANELKKNSVNFTAFMKDVLTLLKRTGDDYGLNATQTIALYSSHLETNNFKERKAGFFFELRYVEPKLIEFLDTSSLSRKHTISSILRLILNTSTEPEKALGELIRIKNKIDKEMFRLNVSQTIEDEQEMNVNQTIEKSIEGEHEIKAPKNNVSKANKKKLTKSKTVEKKNLKNEQNDGKIVRESVTISLDDVKSNENVTQKIKKEKSSLKKLVEEIKPKVETNEMLDKFM